MKHSNPQVPLGISPWIVSVVYALTILTFPKFFLFNPLEYGSTVLGYLQVVSTIGWLLIIFVAPFLYKRIVDRKSEISIYFLVSVLLWPLSTLVIRIFIFAVTGQVTLVYLQQYPIFIFTEIVAPIAYVFAWLAITRNQVKSYPQEAKQKPIQTGSNSFRGVST